MNMRYLHLCIFYKRGGREYKKSPSVNCLKGILTELRLESWINISVLGIGEMKAEGGRDIKLLYHLFDDGVVVSTEGVILAAVVFVNPECPVEHIADDGEVSLIQVAVGNTGVEEFVGLVVEHVEAVILALDKS